MEFEIQSTSPDSAEVAVIPLGTTGTTRRALKADIVRKVGEPQCVLRCSLFHQRKKSKDEWEDLKHVKLSNLRAGEGVVLHLDSNETSSLIQALEELKVVAAKRGVRFGKQEIIVADKESVIPAGTAKRKRLIEQLIHANQGDEFWKALHEAKPDLVKRLSYAELHLEREQTLKVFHLHLNQKDWDEPQWEDFFYRNQWIFGYGLRYQFLGIIKRQASYGGKTYKGTGEQRGEFLTSTSGEEKFTVIVEIKRPDTALFDQGAHYRSGVPKYSSELVQAVSQAQVNSRTWDVEGSRRERDREELEAARIYTITPRAILVIGNTNELKPTDRRNGFELLRRNLRNPDIITFDELYDRARYILGQTEAPRQEESQIADDDIPF